jgi:hypothetical protein
MPEVQPGLAILTPSGWSVTEPNEGGKFGPQFDFSGRAMTDATAKKLAIIGASQYSRCDTEVRVTSAQIINEVLYITHAATLSGGYVNGQIAFCAVDGHFVHGPITVLTDTTLTMPAPGEPNTAPNTGGTQFLHFLGMHASASWVRYLQARWGMGMKFVGNLSQHGANVGQVAARMRSVRRFLGQERPDVVIFEPGWGNSLNEGASWDATMTAALQNLDQVCPAAATVVLATLPPPAPGAAGITAEKIGHFHRLNNMLLGGYFQQRYPNVIVVDCTRALMDYSRTDIGSILNVHTDDLHWNHNGAKILADSCFGPALDRLFPVIPVGRSGAGHVWANGNNQLFQGLTDAAGYTPAVGGITSSGTCDAAFTIEKAGGGAVSVAFTKTQLPNLLYKQTVAITNMAATTVMTLGIPGAAGSLLKDRLAAGRTYRVIIRAAITAITGTVKSFNVVVQLSMTGHPGTQPRTIWAGRTQFGEVEGTSNAFNQITTETAIDYIGEDITIPAGVTITDARALVAVGSGSSGAACTFDVEDVTILDVTP